MNKSKQNTTKRATHKPKARQLTFNRRGGKRRGAGRKPKGQKPLVSHRARTPLASRVPVLVTMRLRAGLPSLRSRNALLVLHRCFRAANEAHPAARIVHFSIQSNHIHMILEADSTEALSRAMQGLSVRIAYRLDQLWKRTGSVFEDRFHSKPLPTPGEVRNALRYVLNNAKKHGCHFVGIDPFSSGAAFDGWKGAAARAEPHAAGPPMPIVAARSWLLRVGWRRHGLIDSAEIPGGAR